MKKFRSKILVFALLLLAGFVLVACGDSDQKLVDEAKEELVIGFTGGDTALTSITSNVTLPSSVGDVTVVWETSDATAITVAGVVTRAATDKDVTLTATLTKGNASAEKEFELTVIALDTNQDLVAKNALIAHYEETLGNPEWKATANVELISTISDVDITWAVISGGDNFTVAGVVTRPAFQAGDATVQLRATIGSQTHNFFFVIEKLEETIEEKINKALELVTIVPASPSGFQETNFNAVKTTKIDGEDIDVTWTSSDLNSMLNDGTLVVYYENEERTVTLTASITLDGVTLTKDIEFKVKGMTPFPNLGSALIPENVNEKIFIENVVVFEDLGTAGYYLYTSDNKVGYVHGQRNKTDIPTGKLLDIIATVDNYYGAFQLKDVSVVEAKDGDLPTLTHLEMTFDELTQADLPSNASIFNHKAVVLKDVKVYFNPGFTDDRYTTYLVKQDFVPGTALNRGNAIMIYYHSKVDVLTALDGFNLDEVKFIINGYRTDLQVWYVNFFDHEGDIELTLTPAQEVDATVTAVENSIAANYYFAEQLDLIEAGSNTTVTWETSHPDIIALNGEITLPATRTEVTLTATITSTIDDTVTDSVEIKTTVGDLAVSDISDLLAGDNKEVFRVQGIITSLAPYNSFTLEDETGAVAFRVGGANAVHADLSFEVGDEISVIVSRALFSGLIQGELVGGLEAMQAYRITIVAEDQELPAAIDLNGEDLTNDNLEGLQSHLINLDNLLVTAFSTANYGNVEMTLTREDGQTIFFKWDSRLPVEGNELAQLKVGDVINLVAAPLSWNNGPVVMYDALTQVVSVETDADALKLSIDTANLDLAEKYSAEFTLPTTGAQGSAITWVADPAASLVDGKLVIPTEGSVTVDLTATLTLAEKTETKEFTVTLALAAETELFRHYKFDVGVYSGTGTGYVASDDFTWTESFGDETVQKDRVQINKSNFAPHDDEAMLVFSIRDTASEAWMIFDFTDVDGLAQISFEVSAWNNTLMDQVKNVQNGKLSLQVKSGDNWVDVEAADNSTNVLSQLVANEYVEFAFDVAGAGVYRIIYSGNSTATGNTTTAITVDNLKLFK